MKIEGRVGEISASEGTYNTLATDVYGNIQTVTARGKYAHAALAGRLFYGATQTGVTTSTTKHNTFTGLALVNPTGSGKVFIVHEFSYAFNDSPAGDTNLSLAVGAVHSGYAADITVLCCRHGVGTSVAILDSAATITGSALSLVKHIATIGTNLTTDLLTPNGVVDLGGSIILDPGRVVCTDTTLATGGTSALFAFMWEEVDV